ncbi:hypothetical protein DL96DRAFT_1695808 [Flagelloscypha sp. PMI_526]|nr:hypothetical protein DL96DRAFT_1695808 [Flagelloscypha sp. PMI_526]
MNNEASAPAPPRVNCTAVPSYKSVWDCLSFSPLTTALVLALLTHDPHNSLAMPGLLFDDLPMSPPSSKTSTLEQCLEMLNREIKSLLEKDRENRTNLDKVTIDAEAFKAAYVSADDKRKKLLEHTVDLEKQNTDMINQLKANRVTVIIDGDGAIFNGDLVIQGSSGGHAAARKLNDQICEKLSNLPSFQLRAFVFLNKRGLADAFGRAGLTNAKSKLDEFILGINQAAERFYVVDVGYGKEAADAKVRACLEDELKLPQNLKVVFGGCHDNGYVSTLRSHVTAGYGSKLVLLPGYADMAQGIAELNLPTIVVPDLFLQQKLRSSSPVADLVNAKREEPIPAAQVPIPMTPPPNRQRSGTNPTPAEAVLLATVSTSPSSYSSALQTPPRRPMTPELAPRCDSPLSNRSVNDCKPAGRHPTADLPLSKRMRHQYSFWFDSLITCFCR